MRYIDADYLSERLEYYISHTSGEYNYAYKVALREVANSPTADVEEVRCGEWLKPQFVARRGFYEVKEFKCSMCNRTYEVKQPCNLMNYCPYCGTKIKR